MNRPRDFVRVLASLAVGSLLAAAELRTADLVPHLDSPRAEERFAALTALADIGDAPAVTAGIAAARKQKNMTSDETRMLGRVLAHQDIARSAALLADMDADVVAAAIADLGLRPAEHLLPVVKDLLGRGDQERKIVQSILELALRQPGTTPAYAQLALVQFADPEPYRRQTAVRSLSRLERLDRSVVEHLLKDESPIVRIALVEVLAIHSDKAKAAGSPDAAWLNDAWYGMAADTAGPVRQAFINKLDDRRHSMSEVELKRQREIFLKALDDPQWEIRSMAVGSLNRRGAPELLPHIERLASDPAGVVASVALGVAQSLKMPNLGDLAFKACSLPHPQNRWVAIQILQQIGDPRLVAVATRLLDDPDSTVRDRAQEALAKGNVGVDVGAVALAKAANLKPAERQALLVRLAQTDPVDRMKEIVRLYDGMMPEQRRSLMATFARDRELSAGLGEFLLARIADKDPAIVVLALDAVRIFNGRHGSLGLPEAMARQADPDTKIAAAADTLLRTVLERGSWGGGGHFESIVPTWESRFPSYDPENLPARPTPEQIPAFLAAAEATVPAERWRHYKVMVGIDDPRVQATLEQAVRSKDRVVRWAALDAMVSRGDQSDAVLDHALARLLTTEPQEWVGRSVWPAITPRLLIRLATFKKLTDDASIDRLRAEIERRLAAITQLEPVR